MVGIRRLRQWDRGIAIVLSVLLANMFHAGAVWLLIKLTAFDQLQDAARAKVELGTMPAVLGFVIPSIFLAVLLFMSSAVVGYAVAATLTRCGVIRAAHQLRRARAFASAQVPVVLSICATLPAALFLTRSGHGGLGAMVLAAALVGVGIAILMLSRLSFPVRKTKRSVLRHPLGFRAAKRLLWWLALVPLSILLWLALRPAGWLSPGPIPVCLLGVGLWAVTLTAILVTLPARSSSLALASAGLLVLVAMMRLAGGDPYRVHPPQVPPDAPPPGRAYVTPAEAFKDFIEHRLGSGGPGGPLPVILVAAEGGGVRAGYWSARTLAVLNALTDGRFAKHTFAYSGVSGGSLGVSTFVDMASLQKKPLAEAVGDVDSYFQGDFLTRAVAALFVLEPFRYLMGFTALPSRVDIFEATLTDGWKNATGSSFFERPLLQVLGRTESSTPPVVIYNATHAESGRGLEISNLGATGALSQAISLLARREGIDAQPLSVAQAVHLSARFPGISPPASVYGDFWTHDDPARNAIRGRTHTDGCSRENVARIQNAGKLSERRWMTVVDGGYVDNSGVSSIVSLLQCLTSLRNAAPEGNVMRRVSFHVILLVNGDMGWPSMGSGSPEPMSDVEATLRSLERARGAAVAERHAHLVAFIENQRSTVFSYVERERCGGGHSASHVAAIDRAIENGCHHLADSAHLLTMRGITDTQVQFEQPIAGKVEKLPKCPPAPRLQLKDVPLGWVLSPSAHEFIRCASTAPFNLRDVLKLDRFWERGDLPAPKKKLMKACCLCQHPKGYKGPPTCCQCEVDFDELIKKADKEGRRGQSPPPRK